MKQTIILMTCPDETSARDLAQKLVKERLAACVQLSPITSIYTWDGQMETKTEVRMVIKTRAALYRELEAFVREHHAYEVPQFLQIPIQAGLPEYLEWMELNTREPFRL